MATLSLSSILSLSSSFTLFCAQDNSCLLWALTTTLNFGWARMTPPLICRCWRMLERYVFYRALFHIHPDYSYSFLIFTFPLDRGRMDSSWGVQQILQSNLQTSLVNGTFSCSIMTNLTKNWNTWVPGKICRSRNKHWDDCLIVEHQQKCHEFLEPSPWWWCVKMILRKHTVVGPEFTNNYN